MLKGFDEDIAGLDLPDDVKETLLNKANERAAGLVGKNEELISKLNHLKDNGTATQAELEQLRQLKDTYEQEKAESQGQYKEALTLAEQRMAKDREKLEAQLNEANSQLQNLVVTGGLNSELDKIGIDPLMKQAAEAIIKPQVQMIDGKAMINDKPLSEFVAEWGETDIGKRMTLAPNNSGGGANGSGAVNTNSGNKAYSEMSIAEKAQYLQSKG